MRFPLRVLPFRRRQTRLLLEEPLEIHARGEAALGGNHLVAVLGVLRHKAFRLTHAYGREPCAEGVAVDIGKVGGEVGAFHHYAAGERGECEIAVLESALLLPLAYGCLYLLYALGGHHGHVRLVVRVVVRLRGYLRHALGEVEAESHEAHHEKTHGKQGQRAEYGEQRHGEDEPRRQRHEAAQHHNAHAHSVGVGLNGVAQLAVKAVLHLAQLLVGQPDVVDEHRHIDGVGEIEHPSYVQTAINNHARAYHHYRKGIAQHANEQATPPPPASHEEC